MLEEIKPRPESPSRALAQMLLDEIPEDRPEHWRLQELLAQLLEFHWREAKCIHWAMFDRAEMSEVERVEDIGCLGALRRTGEPAVPYKRSVLYGYRYDPEQDTKLAADDKCFFAHDLSRCTIHSLDTAAGSVIVKLSREKPSPPDSLSLIPDELVSAEPIVDSIFRVVQRWRATGRLPPALDDFLARRRPRIQGRNGGPILPDGMDPLEGAIRAVQKLHDTTLAIQGPPGTGKTFTAAHVIHALLAQGHRVGVTSNSHKAICKLLAEVHRLGVDVPAYKIGKNDEEFLQACPSFRAVTSARNLSGDARLVGGTAWAFSAPELEGGFDYLFVDEAGQVSVANLVGMSPSSRNLVLMGDQMQLGQPIQGAHPGESGLSVLEYLLRDHPTIPPDMGIFLGTTWRLPPGICRFISEAVYEGRLHADPSTASHGVDGMATGVRFVPAIHEGNTQASDEEAEAIAGIVRDLLGRSHVTRAARPIRWDDILVVAPYNMQVRNLQRRLGPQARVGSVDRFQGQEAAVVIVSMCASSGDGCARGLEFLLNPNRLNVAISRALCLAIVVGNPGLARTRVNNLEQMKLVNLYCRIVEQGGPR